MPGSEHPSSFRRTAWVLIVAATAVYATIISRSEPLQSANDRSRWCTIWSLLNRGTYQIDEIRERPGWNTIDLARVDGHFYSTKPQLMSTWVAGVTWLICQATGWTLDANLERVTAAVLIVVNALPFGLSLCWLAWLLERRCQSAWAAWFVLITAAFGTLVSPFLTTLNNHTVAAAAVMVAIAIWLGSDGTACVRRFALCGFMSAWAACHDLPAAAFAAWMLWYAWQLSPRATLRAFLPAAAVPALAFLIINYAATGEWQPVYAGYGGETYRFVYEGVPSYWTQPQGVDRNLDTPPVYLFNCLLGHHGWFSLTPVFLLVLGGLRIPARSASEGIVVRRGTGGGAEVAQFAASEPAHSGVADSAKTASLARRPSVSDRTLLLTTFVLTAIVLGFYLTRTGNYNYGGVSCGLRWALFLTPLWVVSLVPVANHFSHSRWFRCLALLLLIGSIYSAWEPMGHPWKQPWMFRELERAGRIDYRDYPPELPRHLYSWFADLPLPGQAAFIEFDRVTTTGTAERMRLALVGEERVGNRDCAVVAITRRRIDDVVFERRLKIDRVAFAAGREPAQCLVWTGQVTPNEQQADLSLFRGLPARQPYHPGFIRYLKSSLRDDALPCQRVAARVLHSSDSSAKLIHRSDVWLCEELPFGVARVDWSISDPETSAILQQESWMVVDSFPKIAPQSPVTVDHLPPFRQH